MSMLNLFWQDGKLINVGISSLTSEDNLAGLDRAAWQTFQENARLQSENATHKEEKALFFNEIDRLKADNANLKEENATLHGQVAFLSGTIEMIKADVKHLF